jgi:hypothetical protein
LGLKIALFSGMVMHIYNPSTRKTEAGESQIQNQPGLHSKFEASLGYKTLKKKKFFSYKNLKAT